MWFIYIVRCADASLYTGITKDIERRIREHNTNDTMGAKYTKHRRPVMLVYQEKFSSRSEALKREAAIKKLTHNKKSILVRRYG
jgi:putative endonuclease